MALSNSWGATTSRSKSAASAIELGEIEAKLAGYPGVQEAVALAHENGDSSQRLVAYYTGEEIESRGAARTSLYQICPNTWCLAAYVTLETLPLTPNGKLDRRALPAPRAKPMLRANMSRR